MKKFIFPGLLLLTLSLVSCQNNLTSSSLSSSSSSSSLSTSSTTTTTSSVVETTVDIDEVILLLTSLTKENVNGYSFTYRKYQDNFNDGSIYSNSLEKSDYKIYQEAFETNTSFLVPSAPTSIEGEGSINGRGATYILNDEYYISGFKGENDNSQDYYQYNENNIYTDILNLDLSNYNVLLSNVLNSFANTDSIWQTSIGFIHDEFTFELDEDNNFVCRIGAVAPEQGYYSHEVGEAKVILNNSKTEILSMSFSTLLYDPGFSSEPDLHANNYTYSQISNISLGDIANQDVNPFDINDFDDSQIINKPAEIVENIADGNISVDNIRAILNNYQAYLKGVSSSSAQGRVLETYDANFNELGPANVKQTKNRYLDNILITETTFDYDDETLEDVTNYSQYVAGEDGIEIMQRSYGVLTGYLMDKEYITSLDNYLSASPFNDDYSATSVFSFVASNGFTSVDDGYGTITSASLISATKQDNTMTIDLTYTSTGSWSSVDAEINMVIVDNVITTFNMDNADGSYNHYVLEYDELTAFEGELIPFEPSAMIW